MPAPQVAAKIIGNQTLTFDPEFSQPLVTVEFGQLTTTHETIGKDKITQVYGEKATKIQIEGVIRQDQIETIYSLAETNQGSDNRVKLVLEEWSGRAVIDSNASIKPRQEIYTKESDGSSHWIYDLSMSFIEVERVQSASDLSGVSNPTAPNQDSGSDSGSDSSDDSGDSSSSSGSDELKQLDPINVTVKESEFDSNFITSSAIESQAKTLVNDRVDATGFSFENTSLSQGGSTDDVGETTVTYGKSVSGQFKSKTVDVKITIEEESLFS